MWRLVFPQAVFLRMFVARNGSWVKIKRVFRPFFRSFFFFWGRGFFFFCFFFWGACGDGREEGVIFCRVFFGRYVWYEFHVAGHLIGYLLPEVDTFNFLTPSEQYPIFSRGHLSFAKVAIYRWETISVRSDLVFSTRRDNVYSEKVSSILIQSRTTQKGTWHLIN